MDKFVIRGGRKLQGRVRPGGMKNEVLPIMAATLLSAGKNRIENVPDLLDVSTMANLLRIIGAKVTQEEGILIIDTSTCDHPEAPYDLVKTMRASFFVLGPLLARFGRAKVSLPGGCAIGPRPVDLHLRAIGALGADIRIDRGYVIAKADGLRGAHIIFDIPTVGGTENLIMAAVKASGVTVIENAAREPEIIALSECLNRMGARIKGAGTSRIEIEGCDFLTTVNWSVNPDRIETATFLAAGAITGGTVTVEGCVPDHVAAITAKLRECGAEFEIGDDFITVNGPKRLRATDLVTMPYPGYPTDMQPQHMALMSVAEGSSVITDTIFPNRFTHVPELRRLGAKVSLGDGVAMVTGVKKLSGAPVMASDLRAGAALVLAGLVAEGETQISRVYHIDRGYERIEEKLKALGADIRREEA